MVTGALGHIGSRLIRELPAYLPGVEIIMVDDLSTQRYASLMNLPSGIKYRFIEADVTRVPLTPMLEDVDVVVHLAALTDASASFDRPEEMERVNVAATTLVAEACAEAEVGLVHASSTSVYGTLADTVDEFCSADDINPQSPYAEAKYAEEQVVGSLCRRQGLRATSLRFGTIFGASPGMRFHTAVNKFCWQAVMNEPLSVWKTAYDQKRPYLDLTDAIRAITFVVENGFLDGNVRNVVTVNATVADVIELIRSRVPNLKVALVNSRRMNQLSYEVLNSRLMEEGFEIVGDMKAAINVTIDQLAAANLT